MKHFPCTDFLRENGIGYKQLANAFLKCAAPDRLQALANSLIPRDLVTCGQKWLAHLTPFFTAREREELGEPLLDANRTVAYRRARTDSFVGSSMKLLWR